MSINDLLALCEKMVAEGKGDNYIYIQGWMAQVNYPAKVWEDTDGDLIVEAA